MTDNTFPSIKVEAQSSSALTVNLPDEQLVAYPQIPEALHGKQIPSFVAEWIIQSDEAGAMIQELLQAPTQSLCRVMPILAPSASGVQSKWSGQITINRPVVGLGGFGRPDVMGFEASAHIDGQPTGVVLPTRLADIVEMSRHVGAWLEKGERVRSWAEDEGISDLSWLPQVEL